jgi:hypothetical protein
MAPKSNFRFAPDSRLKSDIAACPKSANFGSRRCYSITSSALASKFSGTFSPSALAVF